ncbi:uncharacterized protein LOC105205337 [Solenopsis invicta]|uniref:uncharacterized protein LOC105205337 n=1 Tax=Solenopsis invicta TaxID=13686 RepID=UPI00193E1066|nr:uncharacterized protein LOC105205337 [Solenopsis invicta]
MVGPTIQDDLFSILTRFRSFKYALTADVIKMYRQVLIDPAQTPLQRIFWRDSQDKPIRTYELLTVTYGTASAAFLAIRSLRKLAEDNSVKYPIGSRTVLNDFYVDDLVSGAETLQEALAIKTETSQLLLEGLFELHKWSSNDSALLDNQTLSHQKEFVLSTDKESETRALGLIWNCSSDNFKFSNSTSLPLLQTPTKRSILSRIALIFDPLGLLGPSTVIAKLIIQELWRLRLDWDESLPLDIDTKWKRYEFELSTVTDISIPRRVISLDQYINLELHGFSDASELAYGACIYYICVLLALMLTNKVLKSLTCKIESVYLWTDSTIVLAWLQSFSRTWTPFVANRVGEIQQLTTIQDWHHVSSKDNPADLLSRGISPASLPQSQLWWSGPSWLNLNKEDWPQFPYSTNHQDIPEAKSIAIATATTEKVFNIFEQFSSLMKLLRVVSYIFRFYNKLKQRIKHTEASHVYSISPNEIAHSIQVLTRLIQQEYFSKKLELLAKQQNLNKNSSILRLNPFIDEIGILRVGGRLKFSHLPYDAKHPILLPGRHPFSRLIVIHEHQRHFHAGPQATLSAVRQNYWLVSARDVTRQIIRNCIVCIRRSPKMASTLMGNLPKHRITVPERPFFICGIDYAGPFYIKEPKSQKTQN